MSIYLYTYIYIYRYGYTHTSSATLGASDKTTDSKVRFHSG